ncbi:MAG: CRISPR-associated helicase Cas3' [Ardenticatenaceae bacterium]
MSGWKPYSYQVRVGELLLAGKSVILQAPTGAGKTAAALLPFLHAYRHLPAEKFPHKSIYKVPMRVLASQFYEEYRKIILRYGWERDLRVAIQTGEQAQDPEFTADLTFATIDQVLSSWVMRPYSLSKRKGNLNAGAFVGSYLVFDEFHLFDPDSTLPTTLQMLKTLRGVSPFVLMTATFSREMLEQLAAELGAVPVLLSAEELAEIPAQEKERRFYCVEQPLLLEGVPFVAGVVAQHVKQPATCQRSLVVFNQVERAQRFYQALCEAVPAGVQVRLLHSRFRPEDRKRWEDEIRREFGKEKGDYALESLIVVATQVVEVGLDMSCAALHTELAPAASILQRAGRCARYAQEVGEVYLYQVESYAPYHQTEAKGQCQRTWEWLAQRQDRHLSFEDEQALVNYVHTPTDKRILEGLKSSQFSWDAQVQALWGGEGNRGDAARLVRKIQSQSIVVHSDPDQLRHRPFAAECFSFHPGTLQGKFETWLDMGGELPWRVLQLVEDEEDHNDDHDNAHNHQKAAQGNRPIRYGWKKVSSKEELFGARRVALHPALVGYDERVGLTLYPGTHYECEVPEMGKRGSFEYVYRLESYDEHIRLVDEAFREASLGWLAPAAHRIERAQKWREGLIVEMAHLVVWLHDLGKLSRGWQGWARSWQKAIGKPYKGRMALAHTDYDSEIEQHPVLERKMKKNRPPHAVESALAAIPYLIAQLSEVTERSKELQHPLCRAAFTAIARHHAPFSHQSPGYKLVRDTQRELDQTSRLLPQALRERCRSAQIHLSLDIDELPPHYVRDNLLVAVDDEVAMLCYMLLVRALRHADQKGTEKGSR